MTEPPEWRACRQHTPEEQVAVFLRWETLFGHYAWPVRERKRMTVWDYLTDPTAEED